MKTGKTKSFTDPEGNRMVFPSMIIYSDDPDARSEHDISIQAMGIGLMTGLKVDDDWLIFEQDKFPHLEGEVGSPAFLHGRATVYTYAGPVFEEAAREQGLT